MSTIAIAAENGSRADLLPGRMGLRLPVGSPCNDFIGYCDALNNCFTVDNEGNEHECVTTSSYCMLEPLIKDTLNKGHLCMKDTF